ncbi:hypothetical protein BIU82_15795 [Arthrobacter sp. SW1]|uniref:hypothetical protein n=1 Tax=Arthrobacter sp. SW1 TaxID=1920889 RepID=UPI000877DDA9|nr:hypothetical protein [Arthrobacter sp. SW1]OFI39105.1 hypothetical protein BIU82_15795 [Arthrobacter sp. SW1]
MAKRKTNGFYDAPIRRAEPAEHWKQLRQGDRVSVKLAPGYENRGLVDAVSGDHSMVWINLDGGRGRTLVHCGDGVEIVRHEG